MQTVTRNDFLTHRAWFRAVIEGKELVLRHTSALECLGLFVGYLHEKSIDAYAKEEGTHANINYHIVDTFDDIDVVRVGDLLCTSANQTFNDMLSKYGTAEENTIDEQSLLEGLSKYYFSNNESFDDLHISPENVPHFDRLKEWAIEYYDES